MGIPFMPVLGTISNLASVAWSTYQKAKQVQENLQAGRAQKSEQTVLAQRVEELEAASLEQARLIGEASKDLEAFARAAQAEITRQQRAAKRAMTIAVAAVTVSLISLGLSTFTLLR
jgi:hypothetical protein